MKECIFYKKLNKNSVQCTACNHFCVIEPGHFGKCGARQNTEGKLQLMVYGKTVAINIDPVEKKPLYHFLPGSLAYSFGTFGCNFRCPNCQNYDISQINGPAMSDWGAKWEPKNIVAAAKKAGCESIAYTYNEPTVFAEFAIDTMKLAKKAGLKNIWVSNGYTSAKCLETVVPYLDAVNIDVKGNEKFYQNFCLAKLQPILDNLVYLKSKGVHIEITTLVIPKLSDSEEMFTQIATFIKEKLGPETPWHLSRFSPELSWALQTLPATETKALEKGYAIGKKLGLKYVYLGNIYDTDKDDTYCPKCGEIAIKRRGYEVERLDTAGKCSKCGESLDIVL